jgi:hypothetical protein
MGSERHKIHLLPIAASRRHKISDSIRAGLRANGQIPILINDCYLPNLFRQERIQILYGGSASGKSDVKATELLMKAISQPYFRGLFVRKYQVTVRDSQFSLFQDLIKRYGLGDLFRVNKSDMDITCIPTGNVLMSGGLDDVDKLKSIPDVTDIWIEEPIDRKGSVTETDFTELNRRLRCEKATNHIHLTFNPIAKENWIHRLFFAQNIYETFALKTTYRDNAFLPPDIYLQYEALRQTNPDEYRVYGEGEWGSADDMAMRLFQDQSIEDLFTNGGFLPDGERYITADVAFTGADQFVVMVWSGWKVIDVRVFARTEGNEVVSKIQAIANEFGVPGQRVAFDAGGVGIGLRGFLRSAVPFVGAASPVDDAAEKTDLQKKILPRPAFRNLRAQAFHYAAQKVNDCEAAFIPKSVHLQSVLAQELRAIRRMDLPDGGKYQIIPKEEIKDRIGRSPDYADCFSMRAVFDLQNHKQRRARQMRAG